LPSYYAVQELETVESPQIAPPTKKGKYLLTRLRNCKAGRKDWGNYQRICTEILTYCLVPPLLDPNNESPTSDRIHRRDIIFHIPHGLSEFWLL